MSTVWNTGIAAERARHNLKLKKKKRQDHINGERLQHLLGWKGSSDFGRKRQAASSKRQASSIRVTPTGISLISCKDPKRLKKDTIIN